MGKQDRRLQKAKERERDVRQKKLASQAKTLRRRKLEKFPRFEIANRDAAPEFIEAVQKAAADIDFLEPQEFGELQKYLKAGMAIGFQNIEEVAEALLIGARPVKAVEKVMFAILFLGESLFRRIPEEVRKRFLPYNNVQIHPLGRQLKLRFASLLSAKGDGGTIYYSHRKPSIQIEGKSFTVAFSRHAIERICQRTTPRYFEYSYSFDAHSYFCNCTYFEPVSLENNQPAFSVFGTCGSDGYGPYEVYAKGVFGEENIRSDGSRLYYRIGYCPIVLDGEFAKAKSFLLPGYRSTPENQMLRSLQMDSTKRRELLRRSETDRVEDGSNVYEKCELPKLFHQNGIPQVFQWSRKVFEYG